MATPDEFQQRSDAFMNWLRQEGGVKISSKIALVDLRSQNRGRAVVATKHIDEDELLFEIPRRLIMDAKTSDLRKRIPAELNSLEPWQQVVLVMIYESGKGESSRWYPYLRVLPQRIEHILINWSDEELKELQGSSVLGKIGKEDASRALEAQMLAVVKKHPDIFGVYADGFRGPNAKTCLLELAHNMAGVMMAYAFDVEEDSFLLSENDTDDLLTEYQDEEENIIKGMVPLADILNASGAKHNASISYGERELMMSSNKLIRSGAEVFNTFGNLPRSELLRRYGYINDDYAPFDTVEIPTSKIIEAVELKFELTRKEVSLRIDGDLLGIRRKIEHLLETAQSTEEEYQGTIFEDAYDIAKVPSQSGLFPLPLVYTIWLLVAEEAEVEAIKAKRSSEPKMNLKVAWVLRAVLVDRQKDYATSIDEDRKILESDLPVRMRLAIEVRLGEKMILHEALEYFRRVDQNLPGGLGNWEDRSPATTYLQKNEILVDETLIEGKEAKRRRLN